jgi:hypothetical protein
MEHQFFFKILIFIFIVFILTTPIYAGRWRSLIAVVAAKETVRNSQRTIISDVVASGFAPQKLPEAIKTVSPEQVKPQPQVNINNNTNTNKQTNNQNYSRRRFRR